MIIGAIHGIQRMQDMSPGETDMPLLHQNKEMVSLNITYKNTQIHGCNIFKSPNHGHFGE